MIDEYIKNWIRKGDSDLLIIENEIFLPENRIAKDLICFHCQQQ